MIIDCVSDIHGFYPKLDGGDLLIVAGDLTATDKIEEHVEFYEWIKQQDYRKFIVIAGNHDGLLFKVFHKTKVIPPNGFYLCDSGIEFQKLKIWGSPWTPTFYNWYFMKDRGAPIKEKWDLIPDDTDILITHGPPYGYLDKVGEKHAGCEELSNIYERVKPKLHVFGHIHEGYGQGLLKHNGPNTILVNASYVDADYMPVNKPIRIIL